MTSVLHNKHQGIRVHQLANLGGLVAIAGLEHIEPGILLGAFLEIASRLPHLSSALIEQLRNSGLQKLRDRNSEKRAYQYHKSSESLRTEMTLSLHEIKLLISKLGGKIPTIETELVSELRRLIG